MKFLEIGRGWGRLGKDFEVCRLRFVRRKEKW